MVNLIDKMQRYFSVEVNSLFCLLSKSAEQNKFKLYLVGGVVRDLLLGKKNLDFDIIIEGDAIDFVNSLDFELEIIQIQKDLKTVKVKFFDEIIVDFASTREEFYPKKGQLPEMINIGCELKKDVLRRDFTVNSLYISLSQDNYGELIDFVGGLNDLQTKKLKILHDKSFIDDPTRILRGLKFAHRFDFSLDESTLCLQYEYLKKVNHDICVSRLKSEFVDAFNLNLPKVSEIFIEQKIYRLISDEVHTGYDFILLADLIKKYNINADYVWLLYFILFFYSYSDLFILTSKEIDILAQFKTLLSQKTLKNEKNSDIYNFFVNSSAEAIIAFYVVTKNLNAIKYLDELKDVKINFSGNDLIAMGLQPSPLFAAITKSTLLAKLDGEIKSKDDEFLYVQKFIHDKLEK